MVVGHLAPLQLPFLYPVAGNPQLSSRFTLMLEKQLHHGSAMRGQYRERKYAYGLEGSDFPIRGLVQLFACCDCHIGLDNETSLLPQPIDKLADVPPGLLLADPLHRILIRLPSSWDSPKPLQQDQNPAPRLLPGLTH